jgi:uncharacterized protein YrrD
MEKGGLGLAIAGVLICQVHFPTMLKSELINRLAINLDTAEEFGPIAEVWVNGRTHQVMGLGCSAGGLLNRQSRRFLLSQIGSIGHDGVVVKAGAQADIH